MHPYLLFYFSMYASYLEYIIGLAGVAFEGCSAGEVARPEAVVPVGVGEEVVLLGGVRLVGLVQGVQVARRGRVQHVHLTPVFLLVYRWGVESQSDFIHQD